jgi:hypothetical protein
MFEQTVCWRQTNTMRTLHLFVALMIGILPGAVYAQALNASASASSTRTTADMPRFERRAALAKELGGTHVSITEDLPPALWEFNPPVEAYPDRIPPGASINLGGDSAVEASSPRSCERERVDSASTAEFRIKSDGRSFSPSDDPYPAWFIYRVSLMKVFPPPELQPYVDMKYASRIAGILEARCAVLRKLGLKAHWNSNEPQVLPEAFFKVYPRLRGPRVDQPNRSRAAWFAPCVDQPETLRLYRVAIKNLLTRCPEVESFNFLTQDSGSGFCWVPALYPGINGPADCKDRPMDQRVAGFLINLRDAAKEAGHATAINMTPISARQWMIPSFTPEIQKAIIKALPRGLALRGREGPDGRPSGVRGGGGASVAAFYPVIGIPVPSMAGGREPSEGQDDLPPTKVEDTGADVGIHPVLVNLGDDTMESFNTRYLTATRGKPARTLLERMTMVRGFAVTLVGENQADNLLEAWNSLNEAQRRLEALDFGGMLRFGHVLNRWLTRPMVPFPENLTAVEKEPYRRFLFQAKGEEEAADLVDIQAMRMYEGFGARLLFQRVIETTLPDVRSALRRIERIRDAASEKTARNEWALVGKRLEVLICLLQSADNMVAYQAQLDRVRALGLKPEKNPPLGAQPDWARTDMMETARKEIDNTVRLKELLESAPEPMLDTAPTPEEETIMRLGPNLPAQLTHKIDTMNGHWRDYDRIFTVPNP